MSNVSVQTLYKGSETHCECIATWQTVGLFWVTVKASSMRGCTIDVNPTCPCRPIGSQSEDTPHTHVRFTHSSRLFCRDADRDLVC